MVGDNGINENTRGTYNVTGERLAGVVREHEESASE